MLRINRVSNRIYPVILMGMLFCVVYLPNITSIAPQYVVAAFCVLYTLISCVSGVHLGISNYELKALLGFLPFIFYVIIMGLIHLFSDNGNELAYTSNIRGIVNIFIYAIIVYITMKIIIERRDISYKLFSKIVIGTTCIQFLFVIVSFAFPAIRGFFVSFIINNSDDIVMINAVKTFANRAYGLSSNLFDGFGFVTAILITMVFEYGVKNKKNKIIFLSIFMLFMQLLNARSGLVLSLIGMIIVLFFYFDFRRILKYFGFVVIGVLIVLIIYSQLPSFTQAWIERGINETILFLQGDRSVGVYNQIFSADLVYPSDMFFGEGGSPELLKGYSGIDSGYIQCLWRYGIVGMILLFLGYLCLYKTIINLKKNKSINCQVVFIAVIFSLYMFKLFVITNYAAILLVIVIPLCFMRLKVDS